MPSKDRIVPPPKLTTKYCNCSCCGKEIRSTWDFPGRVRMGPAPCRINDRPVCEGCLELHGFDREVVARHQYVGDALQSRVQHCNAAKAPNGWVIEAKEIRALHDAI